MHIGVDLDSVLADTMMPLIKWHNDVYKTNFVFSDYTDYNLSLIWNCSPKEVVKKMFIFYQSPHFKFSLPIKGAKQAISYLLKKHRLTLITARPYDIETHSKEWLKKHFPNKFKAIHHTNWVIDHGKVISKKSEICIKTGVEVMIEDGLEFANDCASAGIKVILLDMPWNQTQILHKNIKRVYSWKEIKKIL